MILIVEDNALLRMDAVAVIKDAGFDAIEASDADEAIHILEARDDIAVIFTDVEMPGSMDGIRLAHAVAGRWPPIKIVATSGHFTLDETALPDGGKFVSKPYSPGQVAHVLYDLTGTRS